jgi:hypothetical protein
LYQPVCNRKPAFSAAQLYICNASGRAAILDLTGVGNIALQVYTPEGIDGQVRPRVRSAAAWRIATREDQVIHPQNALQGTVVCWCVRSPTTPSVCHATAKVFWPSGLCRFFRSPRRAERYAISFRLNAASQEERKANQAGKQECSRGRLGNCIRRNTGFGRIDANLERSTESVRKNQTGVIVGRAVDD